MSNRCVVGNKKLEGISGKLCKNIKIKHKESAHDRYGTLMKFV